MFVCNARTNSIIYLFFFRPTGPCLFSVLETGDGRVGEIRQTRSDRRTHYILIGPVFKKH